MTTPTLRYQDFAPEQPYHAAFVALKSERSDRIEPHDHDFWEAMYVSEGAGIHSCPDAARSDAPLPLTAGSLTLLRPWDVHSITPDPGAHLQIFNVAFPGAAWRAFPGSDRHR